MDRIIILGSSKPLCGTVAISGAKNAVLPILAASLLTDKPVKIHNVPHLHDVTTMLELLGAMGVQLRIDEGMVIHIDASYTQNFFAPYELVNRMRASILVLGPLLAHYGEAVVSLPGGCAIGSRPIDLHVRGLQAMGAEVHIDGGYIHARCQGRLNGAHIVMEQVTVTGTENLLMAAVLADGETILENAACEPEIGDLIQFLTQLGAIISGVGTTTLRIQGVEKLGGGEHTTLPDRIEAGTYLLAGVMTGGQVKVTGISPGILTPISKVLEQAGAVLQQGDDWVAVDMQGRRPQAVDLITAPHPGFPTDMQAQFMAMNTIAQGQSTITEAVFENRFMHAAELSRMGAKITIKGSSAMVHGQKTLTAAEVVATDLRASVSLVLAALVAQGETIIDQAHYIDRGYDCIEEKLRRLGVNIRRESSYRLQDA